MAAPDLEARLASMPRPPPAWQGETDIHRALGIAFDSNADPFSVQAAM